ncbi:MAG: hypothetical protein GY778_09330 [bacterium]|nr:hypothetical protein [bacterium]
MRYTSRGRIVRCPNQSQLIRLASGELDPAGADETRRHLQDCTRCAIVVRQLEATWDVLGTWSEAEPEGDLWPRIQAAAQGGPAPSSNRPLAHGWLPRGRLDLFRAAAGIALAVGLGWTTGWWVSPSGQIEPTGSPEATVEELIESLGLSELAAGSATGLPTALLELDEAGSTPDTPAIATSGLEAQP